jgi:hypothetical protein
VFIDAAVSVEEATAVVHGKRGQELDSARREAGEGLTTDERLRLLQER